MKRQKENIIELQQLKKLRVSQWDEIIRAFGKKNQLTISNFEFNSNFDTVPNSLSQTGIFIANQLQNIDAFQSVFDQKDNYSVGKYNNFSIELNPLILKNDEPKAIKTLIHEGTHALDHLNMGIGSSVAIPFLANLEKKRNNNLFDPSISQNWYTQAQKILNDQNFIEAYGFTISDEFKENVRELAKSSGLIDDDEATPTPSLNDIEKEINSISDSEEYTNSISDSESEELSLKERLSSELNILKNQMEDLTYGSSNLINEVNKLGKNMQNLSDVYQNIKNFSKKERSEQKIFHKPFTEFAAHVIENLSNQWNISDNENDTNYWKNQNDGRVFLKAITKGIQDNFLELDPKFIEKYPDAHAAFNDRIYQLVNFDKLTDLNITNAEQYFQYRQEKRKNIKLPESPNITSFDSDEDKTKLANLWNKYTDLYGEKWPQNAREKYNSFLPRDEEALLSTENFNTNPDRYQSPPVDTNRNDNYTQERSAEHIIDQTHHRLHNYEPHHYGHSSDNDSSSDSAS